MKASGIEKIAGLVYYVHDLARVREFMLDRLDFAETGISSDELTDAVARVAVGDAVFSPRLAGFVLDAFRDGDPVGPDAELETLTPREREVLQLIARGYRYKEIAARLHLSIKTVEAHVSSVLRKLQLSSRHELTRWAHERRLI